MEEAEDDVQRAADEPDVDGEPHRRLRDITVSLRKPDPQSKSGAVVDTPVKLQLYAGDDANEVARWFCRKHRLGADMQIDEKAELVSKFAMLIERKLSEAYSDLIADARAEVGNKHGDKLVSLGLHGSKDAQVMIRHALAHQAKLAVRLSPPHVATKAILAPCIVPCMLIATGSHAAYPGFFFLCPCCS